MAIEATVLRPTVTVFPWQGLDDIRRDKSEIPRAEVRYFVNAGAITDSGVGDTQSVRIQCDLPKNFAYVLLDLNMSMYSTAVAPIGFNNAIASIADANFSQFNITWGLEKMASQSLGALAFDTWNCSRDNLPSVTLIPPSDGSMIQLTVDLYNETTNQTGYAAYFFARFARYDISQAYHWAVNTPTLTR